MTQRRITDDLQALLNVLPPTLVEALNRINDSDNLLEIILDLGRRPAARFVKGEVELRAEEITRAELDFVIGRIGDFDADNRAGMERTLHRISAIRNRRGHIVGLTCRVGRAVYGTIDIIQDLVESGKSLLILGRPGIGKTTILREAARTLADNKRVIIVDTSNEIGGDGDVPHPAVGRARRMQVATPSLQHEVMIEAVENHNPQIIVIDEIGRELEAAAARTIAERGVQLIGTAHGNSLENLLLNPTLSDLVGGIESVTLSDEEARRRGTQKTVLERRAPPTFDVLIEIQERDRMAVQSDVSAAVDALLRGYPLEPELRYRNESGEVQVQRPIPQAPRNNTAGMGQQGYRRMSNGKEGGPADARGGRQAARGPRYEEPVTMPFSAAEGAEAPSVPQEYTVAQTIHSTVGEGGRMQTVRIYPYGVARNRLIQSAKRLGVPVIMVKELSEGDALITLRAYYRTRQQTILEAEQRGIPIYVLRANTNTQIEQLLAELFNLTTETARPEHWDLFSMQAQSAIEAVMNGERYIDLPPAPAPARRIQHEMARQAQLISHSFGKEPYRRVRIYRE